MIFKNDNIDADFYISRMRERIGEEKRFVYATTFGCQQNEADTETALGIAVSMGYSLTDSPENADLIIVNTCAIREHAEMKALSLIGNFKALKRQKAELIIGIIGCMAAEKHMVDRLKQDFHYVSFTLAPGRLDRLPEIIFNCSEDQKRSFTLAEEKPKISEGLPVCRKFSHKAWVSIMYGCNNFCSYCIVPYTRGRERSRDSAEILNECNSLISSGVKEITLLGQNVNSYKSDIGFGELISKIAEIDGDFIIRFMTSHPKDVSTELISAMSRYRGKIAPYFHLPLQSGSDRILKKMNRSYTVERYLDIVKRLKENVPDIALSTDIIVGFPDESEEDFLETLRILRDVEFDLVYAFNYSRREGTVAARMDDNVSQSVKSERLSRLLKMQDDISYRKNASYLDSVVRVLTDGEEYKHGERIVSGKTDTAKTVHFSSNNCPIGEFVSVKITKIFAFDMLGEEINQ